MGKFSKIFHHIETKDLRNKHKQKKAAKIQEEKKRKEFKQYLVSTMETKKYNWREGMTTSDVSTINVEKAPGDGTVTAVNTIDASSYVTTVTGVFAPNDSFGGNTGTEIRNSGSGSGQDGGFALGQQYLSFQGDGYNDTGHAIRWAGLSAIDSTEVDTLEIDAIVGNDSNGGEDPDAAGEDLYVMYKTPAMDQFRFLIRTPDGSFAPGKDGNSTDDIIIPIGASGNSGLNKYSVEIPDFARAKGTEFMLMQLVSSGTGYDNYGITKINFQRRTPLTVVVPLDNPEASSFIRSAPPKSTPKKRKQAVDDKLEASDKYTGATFGNDFPGREVRVGGEDPFASAKIGDDVEPSPQSRADVKKAFGASDLKSALGKPTTPQPADPQAKVTGIVKSGQAKSQPASSQAEVDFGDFQTKVGTRNEVNNIVNQDVPTTEKLENLNTVISTVAENNPEELPIVMNAVAKTGEEATNERKDSLVQALETVKNTVSGAADWAGDTINGFGDAFTVLNQMSQAVTSAYKEGNVEDGKIKEGAPGSLSNPITTKVSNSTAQDILKGVDLNDLITQGKFTSSTINVLLGNLSADPISGNLGAKAIHNNLDPSNVENIRINENGDLVIPDTYAFRPLGHENNPLTKAYANVVGLLGGDKEEATKDFATILDQSIGAIFNVGQGIFNTVLGTDDSFLTDPLGGAKTGGFVPGREDPPVQYETIIPKEQLLEILKRGDKNIPAADKAIKALETMSSDKKNEILNNIGMQQSPSDITTKSEFKSKSTPTPTPTTYTVMGVEYDVTTGRPVENLPDRFVNGVHVPAGFPDPPPELITNKDTSNKDEVGSIEYIEGEPIYIPPGFDANDLIKIGSDGNEIPVNFDGTSKDEIGSDDTTGAELGYEPNNNLNIKANDIIGKSMGDIKNVSEADLDFLIQNGYPVDDIFFGGQTQSPVSDLIALGLSAAAIKLALPLLLKAGGSLVSLVKKEWGMRALTDAAYKTFEKTGVMPPWYHWAAHKLLPQSVLNTYAKLMGLKSIPKSILYTGATPAGDIGMKAVQTGILGLSAAVVAKITELMLQGRNKEADKLVVTEMTKLTNKNIDNMSDDEIFKVLNGLDSKKFDDYDKFLDSPKVPSSFRSDLKTLDELGTEYQTLSDEMKSLEENPASFEAYVKNRTEISNEMSKFFSAGKDGYRNNPDLDPRVLIPDPKGHEYPDYDAHYDNHRGFQSALANMDKARQADYDFLKDKIIPAYEKADSYAKSNLTYDASSDMYQGTDAQILAYQKLVSKAKKLSTQGDKLTAKLNAEEQKYFAVQKKASEEYSKLVKEYKKVEDDLKAKRKVLEDEYQKKYDYYKKIYDERFGIDGTQTFQDKLLKAGEDYTPAALYGQRPGQTVKGLKSLDLKTKEEYEKELEEIIKKSNNLADRMDWGGVDKLFLKELSMRAMNETVKAGGSESFKGEDYNPTKPKPSNRRAEASKKRREAERRRKEEDPRSSFAGTGDDAATFSFDSTLIAGYPSASEQQILRNQLNSIYKSGGAGAAKREQERLLRMYGIYFPLASEGGGGDVQLAHFKPKGKTLFERVSKLKKPNEFFNQDDIKPEFPENPPPKLDPKTGMHPEYGKKAKRYKKLDPISANSMPLTGDPEIDAVVKKQKTINRIKKMARKA